MQQSGYLRRMRAGRCGMSVGSQGSVIDQTEFSKRLHNAILQYSSIERVLRSCRGADDDPVCEVRAIRQRVTGTVKRIPIGREGQVDRAVRCASGRCWIVGNSALTKSGPACRLGREDRSRRRGRSPSDSEYAFRDIAAYGSTRAIFPDFRMYPGPRRGGAIRFP